MTSTTSSTADEGVNFFIFEQGTAGLMLANPFTADPEISVHKKARTWYYLVQ